MVEDGLGNPAKCGNDITADVSAGDHSGLLDPGVVPYDVTSFAILAKLHT